MRIRDVAELASRTTLSEFAARLGPFTLLQRPPSALLSKVAVAIASSRTISMSTRGRMTMEILAMVSSFSGMVVHPIARDVGELSVGRGAQCDVVVLEPSVSKRHALLRWNASAKSCTVSDLASTNGTYVNASDVATQELELTDGDTLSFGDSLFLYMLTPTLYAQLRSAQAMEELRVG